MLAVRGWSTRLGARPAGVEELIEACICTFQAILAMDRLKLG